MVLPGVFLVRQPIALIGPEVTGLVGGTGTIILALVLLFTKGHSESKVMILDNPGIDPLHEKSLSD